MSQLPGESFTDYYLREMPKDPDNPKWHVCEMIVGYKIPAKFRGCDHLRIIEYITNGRSDIVQAPPVYDDYYLFWIKHEDDTYVRLSTKIVNQSIPIPGIGQVDYQKIVSISDMRFKKSSHSYNGRIINYEHDERNWFQSVRDYFLG